MLVSFQILAANTGGNGQPGYVGPVAFDIVLEPGSVACWSRAGAVHNTIILLHSCPPRTGGPGVF